MFLPYLPPRFIVVDDKPEHLKAILDFFQNIGAPCLGIHYNPEHPLNSQYFAGVRALFLDLHLIDGVATEDDKPHFAVIASILEEAISPTGGPFVLVVWTEHEEKVAKLTEYLGSLDGVKPHARPLSIAGLSKREFINIGTGEIREDKIQALSDAVGDTVNEKPQLAALVAWEANVQIAASATLSALMEMVPDKQRVTVSFAKGIDEVLSLLARGAVGHPHVQYDQRAAIASALAPILADGIVNQRVSKEITNAWNKAITWEGKERLDTQRSGKVHRMLHLAVPSSETIRPTDWGCVVRLPNVWWIDDDALRNRFSLTKSQLLGDEFKVREQDYQKCCPVLIRVGAHCDHAQNRAGPLPYLLGLEIPCDAKPKGGSRPASVWSSPAIYFKPHGDPFILAVNVRYSLSVVPTIANCLHPVYRLREQLLMHLLSHTGSYLTRPGIMEF